jgi:hypothetical protein
MKTDKTTGITEGAMRTLLRSALRPIWRRCSRKTFINSVRYQAINPKTGRQWNVIDCIDCKRVMGVSEKERRPLKNGGLSKKPRSVYEVHHISGVTSLGDIRETLGEHFHSLIYGKMAILCVACHAKETAEQTIERNKKKSSQLTY